MADCCVVRPGESFVGRQGLTYISGLTGETGGSARICMTVATLPPGARAKAHLHRGIETAAYVIEGQAVICHGDRLQRRITASAGEYSYIPPDVPHVVMNASDAPCRAVIAHTASNDQEGIVLLPELDALV
ncbi:MAG: cupin domain-containing protein [Betaproteobacteria bacterium]